VKIATSYAIRAAHRRAALARRAARHGAGSERIGQFWRQYRAFAGPALLVSVGYMDPGNWATDLEGGARYKYGCSGSSPSRA
jgi:hypothetical protein